MDTNTTRRMHPLTAIAAVSVTLFSLVGIGAITGLIPTSRSQSEQAQAPKPVEEPLKSAAATQPAVTQPAETQQAVTTGASTPPATPPAAAPMPVAKPVVRHKTAAQPAKPAEQAMKPAAEPASTVRDEAPVAVAQNSPPAGYGPPPGNVAPPAVMPPAVAPPAVAPPKPVCHDCGVIETMREVEKKGEGSGLGAVAGGVAGGVLGHQTGGGRGKDVMTVLGAVGGAFAGHQIEKNVKKVKSYEIGVRMEDGSSRVITQDNPPTWRAGDKVRVANGVITAAN